MELTLNNLDVCFVEAGITGAKYVGVKIQMQDFADCEVIINPRANFRSKLEYYKKAYNEDLTLKAFNGIKIVGFTYGNSYEDIEKDLIG